MKASKIIALFTIAIMAIAVTSCVQDDDFSVPNSVGIEENARLETLLNNSTEVSMAEVKLMYNGGDVPMEAITTNIYVKGYVSSSDQTGNFFKEFYIQDSPSNPTIALKVILEQVDSYNQFNLGREVYINLKGLYIGEERVGNGVITIGGGTETDQYGTTVTRLNLNQIRLNVQRSTVTETLEPLQVSFSQINGGLVGVLVNIDGVEFADNLNGLRYFDPIEVYDTQRTLQACTGFDYSTMSLETSSFSNFRDELLPTGNGSITAVVSKTFDGASIILALNSLDDVNMEGTRCSLLNPDDFSPLFEETFESYANNAFVGNGWTNYAEEGTFRWKIKTTTDSGNSGSKVAWMGAYNSGSLVNIAWLITPAIDLDAQDYEFVNFINSNDFDDGSELELLISTDWDGDEATITSSTWTPLPGNIVSDDEYYQNWVDSGLIDLSGYSGTAYVAFKYIGGDDANNTIDGNFEIDNFKVLIQN
ncbi:MAG: choice-of-anchor J domain-containing protein [Mangrovimonas sp.]|nr:choice-of-anchor J domain-containing protein [Mangrovimonas sp.]MCB0434503.1 choice-of-anchor J domain-containing protein [Mangrovimonas sp.]MCB0438021.1 choice-of-anchor J domain-containing protein [Mangrovimonas sp.]